MVNFSLENKIALITGASYGIGFAIATAYAEAGAKIVFNDISRELVDKGIAAYKEKGIDARGYVCDVTDEDAVNAFIKTVEKEVGTIDILVNNAGISMSKPFLEMSESDYRKIVDINQVSVFLGMKAVVPSMTKNGKGSIVNISSMNGLVGGAVGYTDTKFAVRGITKAAALQLGHLDIRVNSVHPGVIETPMVTQGDAVEVIKEFAKHIPMKRVAKPEEVSNLVLFLASEESSYSTGSEFVIDGGLTAQ